MGSSRRSFPFRPVAKRTWTFSSAGFASACRPAPRCSRPNSITDRSERFLAGELIREKLTRKLDQELPYRLTVEIERFRDEKRIVRIGAVVWVERPSQKGIVIGKGGRVLKAAGAEARANMESLFGRRVHLDIWVKARPGWSNDERILKGLGYVD